VFFKHIYKVFRQCFKAHKVIKVQNTSDEERSLRVSNFPKHVN